MDCENAAKGGIMTIADELLKKANATQAGIQVHNAQVTSIKALDAEVADLKKALALREKELASNGLLAENAKLKVEAVKLQKQLAEAIAHRSRETNKVIELSTELEKVRSDLKAMEEHLPKATPPKPTRGAAKKAAQKRKR